MLRYEWKVHFSFLYLVPTAILALLAFNLYSNAQNPYFRPDVRELHLIFELFWPLSLALGCATILPAERDNGMLELRMSYPRTYALALLKKLLLPFTIWLVAGSVAAWFLRINYMALDYQAFVKMSLPPALFLSGLTVVISAFTLSTPISFLVASAWWGWELISQCKRSGVLALLPYSTRLPTTPSFLLWNRYVIGFAGIALVLLGTWVLYRRPLPTTEE